MVVRGSGWRVVMRGSGEWPVMAICLRLLAEGQAGAATTSGHPSQG